MIHLLLILISITAIELFLFSNFLYHINKAVMTMRKALHIIQSSKISDCWKEKSMLSYSQSLLTSTLILFLILTVVILAFFLLSLFNERWFNFALSPLGIVEIVVISTVYMWLRKIYQ